MSEFTRWQQLNETLGFPLGVKSAASLGIVGAFTDLEEGKKTKKMNGEDIPMDDEDDDEENGDIKIISKDDDDMGNDDDDNGKPCKCPEPELGPGNSMMCKKCNKAMSPKMKKKMKKMKSENAFDNYTSATFEQRPEVGTEEYRTEFLQSLEGHFGNPGERFDSGVNLGEEVLFEPEKTEYDPTPQPLPGEPGFAPQTRIGEEPRETPPITDWEKHWQQIGEQVMQFVASQNKK